MDDLPLRFVSFRKHLIEAFNQQCDFFDARLLASTKDLKQRDERIETLERENALLKSKILHAAQRKVGKSFQEQASGSSNIYASVAESCSGNLEQPDTFAQADNLVQRNQELKKALEEKDRELLRLNAAHSQIVNKARILKRELLAERGRRLRSHLSRNGLPNDSTPTTYRSAGNSTVSPPTPEYVQATFNLSTPRIALSKGPSSHTAGTSLQILSGSLAKSSRTDESYIPAEHKATYIAGPCSDSGLESNSSGQPLPAQVTGPSDGSNTDSTEFTTSVPQADQSVATQTPPVPISESYEPDSVSGGCMKKKRPRAASTDLSNTRIKLEHDVNQALVSIKNERMSFHRLSDPTLRSQVANDSMDLDDINLPLMVTDMRSNNPKSKFLGVMSACYHKTYTKRGLGHDSNAPKIASTRNWGNTIPRELLVQDDGVPLNESLDFVSPRSNQAPNKESPKNDKNSLVGTVLPAPPYRRVLQQREPNIPAQPQPRGNTASRKQWARNSSVDKISDLTEDGDNYGSASSTNLTSGDPVLESLLNHVPMPSQNDVGYRSGTIERNLDATTSNVRHTVVDLDSSTTGVAISGNSTSSIDRKKSAGSEQFGQPSRLRDQAPLVLQPEDFVLNPTMNGGLSFAYSEVVRKRAERQCLPTCTKPQCCGDRFSNFTRISGYKATSRTSLGNELRGIRIHEDDEVIMNYLKCPKERVVTMPSAEKYDVLKKAIAWEFAEHHGKHKHAHQRPVSPPGFWRTEMPSTQEVEADKKAAEELRRRTVEERYREATTGGKWMFRDEASHS